MVFSVDENKNKVLVYAGVPKVAAEQGLMVVEWLRKALEPVNGKGGGGKGGLAQGQVSLAHSLSVALLCSDLIIMEKEIGLVSGRRIV
jgi:alanyl-tRNA synthetase